MTATPWFPCDPLDCASDRLLVLGNIDKVGVLGEFKVIWLNDVATLGLDGTVVSRGRSVGGRGAGPGFINWSAEYTL